MKKIICLFLAIGISIFATGCGVEIADNNGPDDYRLVEITDEDIVNRQIGASSYSLSPASDSDDYFVKSTKVKGTSFSGVANLYTTNLLGKSDITFDVSSLTVDSGNFRLMILHDGEIVHDFTKGELTETFSLRDINGTVEVMIAGESADFKFWISQW